MALDWEYTYPSSYENLLGYLANELEFLRDCLEQPEDSALKTPESIQRIYHLACVLWQSLEAYDLTDLLPEQLYNTLLDWTLNVPCHVEVYKPVKLAIDRLLCSMCAIKSYFYDKLLLKLGILQPNLEPSGASSTRPASTHDLESVNVTVNMLKTLSVVSVSHVPTLISSEFVSTLINLGLDSISKNINNGEERRKGDRQSTSSAWLDGDSVKGYRAEVVPKAPGASDDSSTNLTTIMKLWNAVTMNNILNQYLNSYIRTESPDRNVDLISAILDFFAELCWQNVTRQWLCSEERIVFWRQLLRYLCIDLPQHYRHEDSDETERDRPSLFESLLALEESAVNFFSRLCCGCVKTQEKFVEVFYEVIDAAMKSGNAPLGISRFMRRILLEFILSPGYMHVSIETDLTRGMNKIIPRSMESLMPPPAFPLSKRHQLLFLSVDRTCNDLIKKVTADVHEISPSVKRDEVEQDFCLLSTIRQPTENSPSRKRSQETRDTNDQQTKKTKADDVHRSNNNRFKLMLWERKTNRYVSVDGSWRISEILKKFVPTGEELEVPVLKFLLVNEEKTDAGEHFKPPILLPSPGFLKFMELEGIKIFALYIEARPIRFVRTEHSWNYTPVSMLLALGFLLRFPEYRNNRHVHLIVQSLLGLNCRTHLNAQASSEIKAIFTQEKELQNLVPLLPFGTLRLCIHTNFKNTAGVDLTSADVINFLLIFLTVYSEKSSDTDIILIPEHGEYRKAIQHCHSAKVKTQKGKSASYWPKGTGYSTSRDIFFTPQDQDEKLIVELLWVLASCMNPNPELHCSEYMEYKDDISNMRFVHSLSPLAVRIIKKSCLLPVMFHYLENFSVFEATKHFHLYKTLMLIIRIMITNVQLVEMIITPYTKNVESPGTSAAEQSIITMIELMIKEINEYRQMKIMQETNRYTPLSKAELKSSMKFLNVYGVNQDVQDSTKSLQDTLFLDIFNTLDIIEAITRNLPAIKFPEPKSRALIVNPRPLSPDADKAESASGSQSSESERHEDLYVSQLKKLLFASYEMMTEENNAFKLNVPYAFPRAVGSTLVTIPSRMKRLSRELSNLSSSLPISKESAIFVRHDESRIDVIKALITGPAGTPYMNGCFEFDIFCPDNYPSSPIQVKFITTGRNSVRFNPNLYACGKVCLSVLNTWAGGAGEDWNPQTSTILQVLVSIQGMIFIADPYFNEPGFEASRGNQQGDAASLAYNKKLLPATVKWAMTQQLTSPNPCFEEVIKKHFWLKRDEIKQQVEQWIEKTDGDIKKDLMSEAEKLFKKLDELEQPTD